jgi:hypothetical protein
MLRLIGILIGSALAIGFIIITLGLPTLTPPSSGSVTELPGSGSVTDLKETPQAIETGTSGALDIPYTVEEAVPEPDDLETDPELLVEQIFSPDAQPVLAGEPDPDAGLAVEEYWYAFWSPFRSELAANGFVSRLQETTGIDYRVVKVKTGVYEVAFAYTDDADVEDKLSRIAAATGLDMSGG